MRAIVLAACEAHEGRVIKGTPVGLLPFIDRPFLQHVIENLVGQNIREFDILLSQLPQESELAMGDGSRWGSTIRYHLVRDGQFPYRALRHVAHQPDERIVFVHADRLPSVDVHACPGESAAVVTWTRQGNANDWTGWGVFTSEWLNTLPADCEEEEFARLAMESARTTQTVFETERMLTVRTPAEYIASQQEVLEREFPGLLLAGRAAGPGIWISRNVSLHPHAKLNAPLYIGENSEIGAGVTVGPMAVVGANCLLDRNSSLIGSAVLPGTYVGEELQLTNVVVSQGHIHSIDLNSEISVTDSFILGTVTSRPTAHIARQLLSQITAGGLLAAFSPVLLMTWLWLRFAGGRCVRRKLISTPAPADSFAWRWTEVPEFRMPGEDLYSVRRDQVAGFTHFFMCFLPGLIAAVQGRISLVGVPARTQEEIDSMPRDWQALYLASRIGLISELMFFDASSRSLDDAYAADAFFAAGTNIAFDLRLTGRYLRFVFVPRRRSAPVSVLP